MLSRLFTDQKPEFDQILTRLEARTNQQGIDTSLSAEILAKAHALMRRLRLDPTDTTAQELHQGLLSIITAHDQRLISKYRANNNLSLAYENLINQIGSTEVDSPSWFIRPEVMQAMLLRVPPVATLSRLKAASTRELLVKEDIYELSAALRLIEDQAWLDSYNQQLTMLSPSDFTRRQTQVLLLDPAKWGGLSPTATTKSRVTHLKEFGVVGVLPPQKLVAGEMVLTAGLISHYLHEVKLYSQLFDILRQKQNFGAVFANMITAGPGQMEITSGVSATWQSLHPRLAKFAKKLNLSATYHEIAHPFARLSLIDEAMGFWRQFEFVGIIVGDDELVSFNLIDLAASLVQKSPYTQRQISRFQSALEHEVYSRYLEHEVLAEQAQLRFSHEWLVPSKLQLKSN